MSIKQENTSLSRLHDPDWRRISADLPQIPVHTTLDGWSVQVPGDVFDLNLLFQALFGLALLFSSTLGLGLASLASGDNWPLIVIIAGLFCAGVAMVGAQSVSMAFMKGLRAARRTDLTVTGDDLRITHHILGIPVAAKQIPLREAVDYSADGVWRTFIGAPVSRGHRCDDLITHIEASLRRAEANHTIPAPPKALSELMKPKT
ncbi:MAG: hypothetical protein AAFV53_42255 [Myxococcota bacterium]